MKKPTFAQGIVFDPPFETDYEVTINYIIMKDELIIDGIRYKRVADELTLEDCVKDNTVMFLGDGGTTTWYQSIDPKEMLDQYPTKEIAEKVLLYGLLQSVAYKLNKGEKGDWMITPVLHGELGIVVQSLPSSDPRFASHELAEQAIRIFKNSKFDLKKLFQ
jgi:hypothetical protein